MDVRGILRDMVQNEASDLHVKAGSPPMVRLHGELVPAGDGAKVTVEEMDRFLGELLTPEQRRTLEDDHELDCAVGIRQLGRFRVNGAMQRGTPMVTLRAVPHEIKTIEQLKLPPVVAKLAMRRRGLVLVTGITGSGKSTTLAAMMDHVNMNRRVKIVTIEDPIEFLIPDKTAFIAQREVGGDTSDFHAGLRHVLRQDPDVIMIGEIRDLETMETALKAANTGHLVFATLHTTDAVQTIGRILSFFPSRQETQVRVLLSENLEGVVSMRLVPTANGRGRVPACEVMVASEAICEHLAKPSDEVSIPDLIAQGHSEYGMQTFDQSLMEHVRAGRVTEAEALANATNPSEFALKLRGIESQSDRRWDANE